MAAAYDIIRLVLYLLILLLLLIIIILYIVSLKIKKHYNKLNIDISAFVLLLVIQSLIFGVLITSYFTYKNQISTCEKNQSIYLPRPHCPQGISKIRNDEEFVCQTFF